MKVLYIDIDTLNASHVGCYGYPRGTTPNIDSIAREGVVMENYFCADAPCLPSRAANVSGMFGIHNGAVGHGGATSEKRVIPSTRVFTNPDDENNLFNLFRKKGVYPVAISTFAERHSSWWFNAGFKEIHNQGGGGQESGEDVLPIALKWLDNNQDREDWFMYFHVWDPHAPIRVPEGFEDPFKDQPLDPWYTEERLQKHINGVGPHTASELSMFTDALNPAKPRQLGKITNMEDLKTVIDGYDLGVYYADYIVGQVFNKLKEMNIYEEVAIIISADHGESFGEFAIYQEHGIADYSTCHIPMVIKWPGVEAGRRLKEKYYNIDLAPTMADLLDLPKYDRWDGTSYANALKTGEENSRDYLVVSQMAHVCQRSVLFDNYIYMRTYHDGFRLFDDEMLFDLDKDIHEENDIKDIDTKALEQGRAYLADWYEKMGKGQPGFVDPLDIIMAEGGPYHAPIEDLPAYIERLKSTGREEAGRRLAEKFLK